LPPLSAQPQLPRSCRPVTTSCPPQIASTARLRQLPPRCRPVAHQLPPSCRPSVAPASREAAPSNGAPSTQLPPIYRPGLPSDHCLVNSLLPPGFRQATGQLPPGHRPVSAGQPRCNRGSPPAAPRLLTFAASVTGYEPDAAQFLPRLPPATASYRYAIVPPTFRLFSGEFALANFRADAPVTTANLHTRMRNDASVTCF